MLIYRLMYYKRKYLNNSVVKNISYLGIFQAVNYIFPILTIPYLVKILGKSNFGIIALSQLIVSYVGLFTDYGFNISATKDVSLNRYNKDKVQNIFSNIVLIKVCIASLCLVVLCAVFFFTSIKYTEIYLVALLQIIGQVLFPIWFFQGIEQMGKITVFNALSKILSTACIFIFVKDSSQTIWATFFYSTGYVIAGAAAFFYAINKYKIRFLKPDFLSIKEYLYSGFNIFLPTLFSTLILNGGITVLGMFYSTSVVGVYSAIDRLIKAGIGLLSVVTQSIFPNVSRKFAINRKQAVHYIFSVGRKMLVFVIAATFLLSLFSGRILSVIYTQEYRQYSYVFNWLLLWVIFGFLNNFIGIQFLIGSGNGTSYRKSFLITAVFILLTFPLIKYFGIDGVLISVISGEIFLTCIMLYTIKQKKLLYND